MEAKKYLMQVYEINKNINSLEEELLVLDTIAKGGAINYKERVQSSKGVNTENIVCKIADTKSIINDLIRDKLELVTEITLKINELEDNTLEVILRDRYLRCKCWEQIAVDLNYSIRHVYKLHGKALKSFDKILKRGQ
ncbi:hypothetical protein [Peptostreptococcus russellii]|uniref:hypothetical protein n=1 Tax=Peptostreptococcus russellii TaxID=215200 RepID=UPI003F587962